VLKRKIFGKIEKGLISIQLGPKKSIKESDVVVVKFGEKYKQWNAAFDAGYAAALDKSIIVIQNEDHQHALKEIDAAASAVASDQMQVVRILKYVLEGTLK
jgi:YtoQ family protein